MNAPSILHHMREQGAANRPAATDTDLDELQRVIVNHFAAEHEVERKRVCGFLEQLKNRCEQIANAVFSETPDRLRLEVKTAIEPSPTDRTEIQGLMEEKEKQVRSHRLFRKTNGLHRAAEYPANRTNHVLVVVILLFVESFFNAFLLGQGNDHGFLGGLTEAFAISGYNIALGLVTGYFALREINHTNKIRRYLGILGAVIYIPLAVSFNLMAGHYRDLLAANPETAFLKTVAAFRDAPCDLSFQSWILVGIGLLVSAISLADGYSFDDCFPGYGKIDRALQSASFWVRRKCAEILEKVRGQADAAIIKCRNKINHLKTQIPLYKQQIGHAREAAKSFASATQIIQNERNEMLRGYREENRSIRTSSAPRYFDAYPDLFSAHIPGQEWFSEQSVDAVVRMMEKKIAALETSETGLVGYALELQKKTADEFHRFASEMGDHVQTVFDREEKLLKGGGL